VQRRREIRTSFVSASTVPFDDYPYHHQDKGFDSISQDEPVITLGSPIVAIHPRSRIDEGGFKFPRSHGEITRLVVVPSITRAVITLGWIRISPACDFSLEEL
jgi:hypothetical protein